MITVAVFIMVEALVETAVVVFITVVLGTPAAASMAVVVASTVAAGGSTVAVAGEAVATNARISREGPQRGANAPRILVTQPMGYTRSSSNPFLQRS